MRMSRYDFQSLKEFGNCASADSYRYVSRWSAWRATGVASGPRSAAVSSGILTRSAARALRNSSLTVWMVDHHWRKENGFRSRSSSRVTSFGASNSSCVTGVGMGNVRGKRAPKDSTVSTAMVNARSARSRVTCASISLPSSTRPPDTASRHDGDRESVGLALQKITLHQLTELSS
jgi:hypothetical protein